MVGFNVNAMKLIQHDRAIYLFSMSSEKLQKICYVTPRSKESPKEIQRILKKKRAQEIGDYIKTPTGFLPNSIVISLNSSVIINDSGRDNEVTICFPEQEGKFGYILDGQHRLEGFKHSDSVHFDLPVVAFHNADETLRGKIFADINSKQQKVTDVHLLEIYYQIKDLQPEQMPTMDIVHRLNNDPDSLLQGKIKTGIEDRGKWISNKQLKNCIGALTEPGGALSGMKISNQVDILKNYFRAIKLLWPHAWDENNSYVLTKVMGLEIMLGIFPEAKHRCDLNEGKVYTAETFKRQLSVLEERTVKIKDLREIPLTWELSLYSGFTNSKGKKLILQQLKQYLIEADLNNE